MSGISQVHLLYNVRYIMSSLAATQADGFYHPPDYNPAKHGSVSKFHGSKGHNQYLKQGIVRLELPYKAWCLKKGCERVIDQGTRFNATKKHVDVYFSTKIYEFTMHCPSCDNLLVMRTDPKNTAYVYTAGMRRFTSTFVEKDERLIGEAVDEC